MDGAQTAFFYNRRFYLSFFLLQKRAVWAPSIFGRGFENEDFAKSSKKTANREQILHGAQTKKKAPVWAPSTRTSWFRSNLIKSCIFDIRTLDLFLLLQKSLVGGSMENSPPSLKLSQKRHSREKKRGFSYLAKDHQTSRTKKHGKENITKKRGRLDIFWELRSFFLISRSPQH